MICVYGGTFDPVQNGHLRTALEVQQALNIDKIHLLPCNHPPHRPAPSATPEQRLRLLQLAVADQPALMVDDRELQRSGISYMVDTLSDLRKQNADTPLCLILGMDAFQRFEQWHDWKTIPKLAHLVVMQRPGSIWPQSGAMAELVRTAKTIDAAQLFHHTAGLLYGVSVTQLEISSTQIRKLLASGRSPRYLLPDVVLNEITHQGYYKTEEEKCKPIN